MMVMARTGRKRRAKRANHCVIFYLSVKFSSQPLLPLTLHIDRVERLALAHQKGTSSTLRRAKQSRSILLHAVRSSFPPFPFKILLTKRTALRSPTLTQTHPRRYAYLRPKSHVLLAWQPPPSPSPSRKAAHSSSSQRGTRCRQ